MTTRVIRSVEGTKGGNPSVRWNQLKSIDVAGRERPIQRPTDRQIDHIVEKANPKYVAPEARERGKRLTSEQVRKTVKVYKYPKEVRESLQAAAEEVIAVIQQIADGTVESFNFSLEGASVNYRQTLEAEGEKITENLSTNDETVIEAATSFAQTLLEAVQSDEKPLELAEAPSISAALEPDDVREPNEE